MKPNKVIVSAAEDNLLLQTPIQLVDGNNARTLNLTTKLASLDLKELELLLMTMPPSWDYKRQGSKDEGERLKFSWGMFAAFMTIIPHRSRRGRQNSTDGCCSFHSRRMPAFLEGNRIAQFPTDVRFMTLVPLSVVPIFESFQGAKDDKSILIDTETYVSVRKLIRSKRAHSLNILPLHIERWR